MSHPQHLAFAPASASFRECPYPSYAYFRAQGPVIHRPEHDDWIVTGYEAVRQWLSGPRPGKHSQPVCPFHSQTPPMPADIPPRGPDLSHEWRQATEYHFNHSVHMTAPPYHTLLRKVLSEYLTRDYFENIRPEMEATALALLAAVREKKTFDIVEDFSFPFTAWVITRILGIPFSDRNKLRAWSYSYLRSMNPPHEPKHDLQRNMAMLGMATFIKDQLARRDRSPTGDMITFLLEQQNNQRLLPDAVIGNIMTLIIGGFENTQNAITLAVQNLLLHPEQLKQLNGDADKWSAAIDECLRYDSPAQYIYSDDFEGEICGHAIRRGQRVHVVFAAANRDPEVFPNPDVFDIDRKMTPHLAFGAGIHYCLGAHMAKLEMKIALSTLFATYPGLKLAPHGREMGDLATVRAVKHLTVEI